jgi:hypothetical protein
MLRQFQHSFANHITSAGHVILVVIGLRIGTPAGWAVSLALIALISFALWVLNFRRTRAVADTPTSRIASAPQGYVELYGVSRTFGGQALRAPLTGRECVWYRYQVDEKRGKNWTTVERGISTDSFVLDDGTGTAVVDPEWAEVHTSHRRAWTRGDRRYDEWLLLPDDDLYAIGDLATVGGANSQLDAAADVNALLKEWKADQPSLKGRFDLNGDGQIDLQEWELARRAARREVVRRHDEIRAQPGVNVLRKTDGQRPFLLANMTPERMARRYGWWTRLQLGIAVVASCAALYLTAHLAPP